MSSTFKYFGANDKFVTSKNLYENIPLQGTMIHSQTSDINIQNPPHGMFQCVYDFNYLTSAANHIFDITIGHSDLESRYLPASDTSWYSKKVQMYNLFCQTIAGYEDGEIKKFGTEGNTLNEDDIYNEVYFLTFTRLLAKNGIKKGSFNLQLGIGANYTTDDGSSSWMGVLDEYITIKDEDSLNNWKTDSPLGDYGILKIKEVTDVSYIADENLDGGALPTDGIPVGLIFYQAGIVLLTTNIFAFYDSTDTDADDLIYNIKGLLKSSEYTGFEYSDDGAGSIVNISTATGLPMYSYVANGISPNFITESYNLNNLFKEEGVAEGDNGHQGAIIEASDGFRKRIQGIYFNNTIELVTQIFSCAIAPNEFNYSSNPTYLENSKIRVKSSSLDAPITYITKIGIYSADNVLLASASLSEPIKKTPEEALNFKVRLDY